MDTKRTSVSSRPRTGSDAKADARVRPSAPSTETDAGEKTSLTPEQRRAFESGLKRFDALYRKLAE